MRELGGAAGALQQSLAGVLGSATPLERRLQLRCLQQGFVLNTLLMKKTRVGG